MGGERERDFAGSYDKNLLFLNSHARYTPVSDTKLLCFTTIKTLHFTILFCADNPTRPGRPHVTKVSDREVYMIWEEPESDGNSYISSYRVDWHRPGRIQDAYLPN